MSFRSVDRKGIGWLLAAAFAGGFVASAPVMAGQWGHQGRHHGWHHGSHHGHGGHFHGGSGFFLSTWPGNYFSLGIGSGSSFFYGGNGVFFGAASYRPVVLAPPVATVIPPPPYQMVNVAPAYYYPDPGWYRPAPGGHRVVPPAAPATPAPLYPYPARGQNVEQQERDRYECHRWASNETRFDPSLATQAPNASTREEFQRAVRACLAGRGYTVG
jgi:hypothetical protein